MKGKILYAGYDPDENDFTDCELAPLHDNDPRPDGIDVARAFELKASGKTLKQIGTMLAREMERGKPFHANSVWMAMKGIKREGAR